MKPHKLLGQGLAQFMEHRGRRIAEAGGVLWHEAESRMYMSLPYTLVPNVRFEELSDLLRRVNGAGVRYPSRKEPGLPGGLYVCRNRDYGYGAVQSRLRSMVRKGMQRCEVKPVPEEVLIREGIQLNRDTMERQGRFDSEFGDPARWTNLCKAVGKSPKIRVLGAFVDGFLAAYSVVYEEDNWTSILHQNSRVDLLEHYPNHALAFTITSEAMAKPDMEGVSYGLKSLVNTAGLHDFKLRIGFECEPQNSVCYLHPALAPVLTSGLAVWSLKKLRQLRSEDQTLQRVESVVSAARALRQGRALEPAEEPVNASKEAA